MEAVISGHDFHHLKADGWIPCSEKLPPGSQFVMYRTPKYQALGKMEREKWYYSGQGIEPEQSPVLCWQPLN